MAIRGSKRKVALAGTLVAALAAFALWLATGQGDLASFLEAAPATEKGSSAKRAASPRGDFSGEVVAVLDGDTIDVMRDGKAVRVRLAEIDCPEKRQPFGMAAKKRASQLAFGRTVRVEVETVDRYGRAVARVALSDGKSLNETLLRDGLAWWYRQYSKDARLGAMEEEARDAKRGLWADEDPTPPWKFRRKRSPVNGEAAARESDRLGAGDL